ncbi:MAG: hypothetical protein ABJB47_00055 [Actinomycetota bacterium]
MAFEALANTPQAQAATSALDAGGGLFTSGFAPVAATLTQSGGSVAVDASQANVFNLALAASGWTISKPANPVGDGQDIRIRLSQDSTGGRTVSWGAGYDWGGANRAPTLSTAGGATDILSFEYDAASSKWCYLGATFPQDFSSGGTTPPPPPPPTSISVVQSAYFGFNTEGDFAQNVTPGNSVVLIVGLYTSATSGSFTTSNPQFGGEGRSVPGTKLLEGTGPPLFNGFGYTAVWLLPNVAGGSPFVRVEATVPAPGGLLGMFAYEVAGLGAAPQLDPAGGVASRIGSTAGGNDTLTSGATPAITQAPEIIFGFGHIYAVALNPPSGAWITQTGGGAQNFVGGYQIAAASGGTYSWTETSAAQPGSWGSGVTAICAQPAHAAAKPATVHPGEKVPSRQELRDLVRKGREKWERITGLRATNR